MPWDSLAWRATSASVVRAKPYLAIESTVASISCTRRTSLMSLRAIAASLPWAWRSAFTRSNSATSFSRGPGGV